MARISIEAYWKNSNKKNEERWNFIRANEKYGQERIGIKRLYEECQKLIKGRRYKKWSQEVSRSLAESARFAKKWGVMMSGDCLYPDPKKSFNTLTQVEKIILTCPATKPSYLDVANNVRLCVKHGKSFKFLPGSGLDVNVTNLTLEVDLNYSTEKIKSEFEVILKALKTLRKKMGLQIYSRPRAGLYKDYIQTYRSQKTSGKLSSLEMAKKLLPGEAKLIPSHGSEFIVQRLQRNKKAAKKFIEKGAYKSI